MRSISVILRGRECIRFGEHHSKLKRESLGFRLLVGEGKRRRVRERVSGRERGKEKESQRERE